MGTTHTRLKGFIMAQQHQISKKRKFVADGVFYAELNEFLYRELSEDGYAGIEVRMTPTRTEVIIRATRTKNVLGEKGRRIRELTTVVQRRWGFKDGAIELYAERVYNRAFCAAAQCESVKYKLLAGLAVRRALRSVALHHGERRQGSGSQGQRKASRTACQVHEVQGRIHVEDWRYHQLLCRE